MRKKLPDKLELGRLRSGPYGSSAANGAFGVFTVMGPCGAELRIVSSGTHTRTGQFVEDTEGWEHVSVSTQHRTPNWLEMCFVKDLFWEPEECVVQFHPPASKHVNNHPNCLHMWRHIEKEFPQPPDIMVGVKSEGVLRGPEHAAELRRKLGL